MCNNIIRIIPYNNGKEMVTKIKIINIYHRVSKIHKKKKEKKEKNVILGSISPHLRTTPLSLHCGTWLDWKSSRHIHAEIRQGRAEKNGRKSVSVRVRRNYIRVTRFCLVESRGYIQDAYNQLRHLFDAGQIRFDVLCFLFLF